MLARRDLLKTAVAAYLLGGLPRLRATPPSPKTPRYFVTIFLRGGIDAVYTTNPRTRADVDKDVDVPYGPDAIVDTGKMQLGPHFRPLARFAEQMAIVRGVQVSTANHQTGAYQVARMRTSVEPSMPSLHDIIGQRRDGQPLSSVTLGKLASFDASPGSLIAPTGVGDKTTSLDVVDELSDEEAAMLAKSYAKHLKELPSHLSGREEITRDHVEQVQAFFQRLVGLPRFKPESWETHGGDARRGGEDLQRTLWFLEHDLCRGVMCKIQFDWDSHYRNEKKQTRATGDFVNIFSRFLDGLHTRRNEHGTLAEQTVVVVGSELGRFPVINGNLGKDHFPEAHYLVMGPGVVTGQTFVPTGKRMEGVKVDFKTGKPDDAGDHLILDDLGATLLHLAGLNPELYGYNGRRLGFLVQA